MPEYCLLLFNINQINIKSHKEEIIQIVFFHSLIESISRQVIITFLIRGVQIKQSNISSFEVLQRLIGIQRYNPKLLHWKSSRLLRHYSYHQHAYSHQLMLQSIRLLLGHCYNHSIHSLLVG